MNLGLTVDPGYEQLTLHEHEGTWRLRAERTVGVHRRRQLESSSRRPVGRQERDIARLVDESLDEAWRRSANSGDDTAAEP